MTQKRKPTYDLDAFKAAINSAERLSVTGTAVRSVGIRAGRDHGDDPDNGREHFYKSMTVHANRRLWQDVYHVPSRMGVLYVTFTADAVTEFLLLSFKEKGHG